MDYKKTVTALFLAAVLFASACSSVESQKQETSKKEPVPTATEAVVEQVEDEDPYTSDLLPIANYVPGTNVVINEPRQPVENKLTDVMCLKDEVCVAVTGTDAEEGADLQAETDEILEIAFYNLKNYVSAKTLNITSSKFEVISETDIYWFEGVLNCDGYRLPAFGFTAIIDGSVVNVLGFAGGYGNQRPSDDQIKQARTEVDAMMYTLRVFPQKPDVKM